MTIALLAACVIVVLYAAHELRHAPSEDDTGQATVTVRWMEL